MGYVSFREGKSMNFFEDSIMKQGALAHIQDIGMFTPSNIIDSSCQVFRKQLDLVT